MLATSFTLLLLAALARAQTVVLDLQDVTGTFYYDLDEEIGIDVCSVENGGPDVANWAITSGINGGVTYCQGSDATAYTLESLGSNRIVALNATMVKSDPTYWCGKEVQVWDSDGNEIVLDEGPFVVYDACAECAIEVKVDFSAKAFTQIKGGTCSGNNPSGLTVKVLDTNVSPSGTITGGSGATATATATPSTSSSPAAVAPSSTLSSYSIRGTSSWWSSSSAAGTDTLDNVRVLVASTTSSSPTSSSTVSAPTTSTTAPTSTSSSAPSASVSLDSGSSCTYGTWQCNGLTLQVCNYVSTTSLAWETITTCETTCSFTDTGSVDCE